MRAGMNEDRVYTMDRPELLEAMANVMQNASVAAAAVSDPDSTTPKTETQLQFELMRMQLEQLEREMQFACS